MVDPAVAAAITDVSQATGFRVLESDDTSATLFGVPTMLTDGSYGSVTFTTGPDYDGSEFSINVASFDVLTADGDEGSGCCW